MRKLTVLDWIALVLVIIGAIAWGLIGLMSFDFIATVFGKMSSLTRIIYDIVGLAGLYLIFVVANFSRKE
jgi:uncharacterized membrane protein YuzA (DUF378 family)